MTATPHVTYSVSLQFTPCQHNRTHTHTHHTPCHAPPPPSAVNFSNPHINIGLPVFTIHGNHDDPAGQDNLSAVDLLSSCGLVNYFGKQVKQGAWGQGAGGRGRRQVAGGRRHGAGGRGQEAGGRRQGGLYVAVMVCFMPEGESIER